MGKPRHREAERLAESHSKCAVVGWLSQEVGCGLEICTHTRCQGALPGLFPEGREGSRAGQKSGYDAVPAEALVTPGGSDGKASARNAGDLGSIPGSGRSPGDGYGNPLQYSCLENSMDRGTL